MDIDKQAIGKLLSETQKGMTYPMTADDFIVNATRYIKAVSEGRMMCVIDSVSRSGMSRVMHFSEFNIEREIGRVYHFWNLFKALGYSESRNKNGFLINGCGMDMVFNTNYNIIHTLQNLGFLTKAQCDKLAQKTPTIL